jgi:hypothetical protein
MNTHTEILTTRFLMRIAALACTLLLTAAPGAAAGATVFDGRFNHNRSYPARGIAVREIPAAALSVRFHDTPYYVHEGTWYRPYGGLGFRVIAPPIGVFVPYLPTYYTTVWSAGIPYYYANDVYYRWMPDQREYIVSQPPDGSAVSTQAPADPTADEPFIYPQRGQDEPQQETDRYECHSWAAGESHFDPTQPSGSLSADEASGMLAAYFRAMSACLESRGYSVK